MSKTKLAVCIGDAVYQNRFVKCLINHYQSQFEVSIFSDVSEIATQDAQEYEVIIVGDCDKEGLELLRHRGENILYLSEEQREMNACTEHVICVEKYQEVYKIVDSIEQFTGKILHRAEQNEEKERQVIGVFSLEREEKQLPFAATLCSVCSENAPVLLINMQPYSYLENIKEYWGDGRMQETLEMEDLMAVATTGVYTKGRLLAGIGREQNWEYVHSVRNPESLAEGSSEIYRAMINILSEELGYKTIVINFGSMFSGMTELMGTCDSFFLLVAKEEQVSWREEIFVEVIKKHERENFFRRVTRFEIPAVYSTDDGWRQLAEKWRWSEIGESLREKLWVAKQCG